METVHIVLTWLAVWVASSVVLSPLLGMWIKNSTNYSFEDSPTQLPSGRRFNEPLVPGHDRRHNEAEEIVDQTTTLNPSPRGPYRSAWSVVWRIAAIPMLVFAAGWTIFMLIEHQPSAAAPSHAAQHLAQLQQLKDAWIEKLSKGRAN